MTRIQKTAEAESARKEELVQEIVSALDRTFAASERPRALSRLAEMFRGLDEATLRALAYRQGLFEEDLEPTEADREREAP